MRAAFCKGEIILDFCQCRFGFGPRPCASTALRCIPASGTTIGYNFLAAQPFFVEPIR